VTRIVVERNGDRIIARYPTARLTEELYRQLVAASEGEGDELPSQVLARLLDRWDATANDGIPTKPTEELLGRLPFPLVLAISTEVQRQWLISDVERKKRELKKLQRDVRRHEQHG
jgi:hypothetical protein